MFQSIILDIPFVVKEMHREIGTLINYFYSNRIN